MKSALRLRRPADFARVRRNGRLHRHPAMAIGVCANDLLHNRYGVVTGRRIGIAVVRNRFKRRLVAALDALHPALRQGFDIVVIARQSMIEQPFSDLQRILRELFTRAKLIETC
ncbi:MAG: ribonuclease P protein component [Anaerolineae bacterium]|nr:ribonuclease P protein component [Anaerolineae bacterium]